MKVTKIAVGSRNPVKIRAVKLVTQKAFSKVSVVGIAVASGVSNQPIGDRETIKGAINRARAALHLAHADLGVGLEGGVIKTAHGLMSSAWCALVDKNGKLSLGGGMHFHLPKLIEKEILKGKELGLVMDELTGETNSKQKGGAINFLTKGILTRAQAYGQLVKLALVKFCSPEYF